MLEVAPASHMNDDELVAMLRDEERAAISWRDSTLADEQANAIDYYEAEPFGDEEEGRSQVVTPDVAEVVDYMTVSIMRTVASGDRVVEFEPGDTDQVPQDQEEMKAWQGERVQAAEDATEAVNYMFMRKQNGYRILLDWLQSGLIEKIGIMKTACITERKKVKQTSTVSEDVLAYMMADGGVPIIAVTPNEDGSYAVTAEQEQAVKRYIDMPVPSEEFLFSARTRDEDSAFYLAHRCRKSLSELVEMGFDRDTVEGLPTDDTAVDLDRRGIERWDDEVAISVRRPIGSRFVWLLEEYARVDRDNDGVAELVQVFRVDDVILSIEEVEQQPFVVWTPFPRAHRMVGNSLAEKVMDIQRVNSVLLRQALDGTYMTNSPRMAVDESGVTEDTYDDLLNVRPGGLVRYKGVAPQPLHESFDIQKSLGMMEFMMGQRETRTGITRLNQGLDADTLNKTASGQAAMMATGQQIEEFVARNFAEAVARLFVKKLKLMKDHGNAIAMKVDGTYRRVDPTSWDDEMNVAVRVGLGSGRKEQRLVYRQGLAQFQIEGLQYGLTDPKRIYNNQAAMVRDSGLGNPSDYWIDPDSEDYKPPEPQRDPAALKVQADTQAMQAKQQLSEAVAQADIEHKREMASLQMELARQEAEAKAQLARDAATEQSALAREKAEFEAQMAQQQANREFALAERRMEQELALSRERAAGEHAVKMTAAENAGLPKNRPGGDLDK